MTTSSRHTADLLRGLNVAQLETFRQVMKWGGYAAAARQSQLSVPSVWQHVQALEKTYGVRLFEREGRHVKPTAAAQRLYEQMDGILVRLESTIALVQETSADTPIRLVTGVRMMLEDLAAPLSRFHARYGNRLSIRYRDERRAEELLLADEVDLALALEPGPRQASPLIHYEPAYTVDFLAVMKRNHPYANSKSRDLRELAKHNLIVAAPGTHGRDALDQALHREGLQAQVAIETDNSAFTIACVSAGMGIGILAGRSDGQLCRKLATKSLSRQLGQRRIMVMWRKSRLLIEPMVGLVEEIKRLHHDAV